MYGTVFVVRTGVFIQARGQQDTSDIYRFDDMSAEVVKFFFFKTQLLSFLSMN